MTQAFRQYSPGKSHRCYVVGCLDPIMYESDYPNGMKGIPYRIGGFGGTQYRHAYHGYPSKSLSERLDTPYNLTMWQAVLAVNKGIKTSSGYTLEHWTNAQIELEDLWSRIQKRIPK